MIYDDLVTWFSSRSSQTKENPPKFMKTHKPQASEPLHLWDCGCPGKLPLDGIYPPRGAQVQWCRPKEVSNKLIGWIRMLPSCLLNLRLCSKATSSPGSGQGQRKRSKTAPIPGITKRRGLWCIWCSRRLANLPNITWALHPTFPPSLNLNQELLRVPVICVWILFSFVFFICTRIVFRFVYYTIRYHTIRCNKIH